ncbi:MAG: dipeptidase [Pseudomonadota bacterium]
MIYTLAPRKRLSKTGLPFLLLTLQLLSGCALAVKDTDSTHSAAIVIDTHSDFIDRSAADGSALNEDPDAAQTSLHKLEQGEVDAQFFSVFVPPAHKDYGFARRAYEQIDQIHEQVHINAPRIEMAYSAQDIENAASKGVVAALIGVEGGHAIENRLAHLRNFYRLGVRYMTLTWANTNEWADASGDEAKWSGLNEQGVAVVKEMNRLGMMVDVSHVSDDTFWDVLDVSQAPVIASHSLARGVMDHPRNMNDKMIKALAANDGVVQVSFYSQYISERFHREFKKAYERALPRRQALDEKYANDPVQNDLAQWALQKQIEFELIPPSLDDLVAHFEHIIDLVGVDHVGLGSDFDGMGAPPAGLEHIGLIQNLTDALIAKGHSTEDMKKILGGNLLRVMRANEELARKQ